MKKKDIRSIAYLYKEMDPSEELEFERALKEDENLLIEVESLRRVQKQLGELPAVSAPEHVLDSVYKKASEKPSGKRFQIPKAAWYSAAALLVAGFMAGALLIDSSGGESEAGQASAGLSSSPFQITGQSNSSPESSNGQKVSPWIDNNEMLRFSDRTLHSESADVDSALQESYRKLTPVTEPSQSNLFNRHLHLTGGRQ